MLRSRVGLEELAPFPLVSLSLLKTEIPQNHLLLLVILVSGYWSESAIFLEFCHKYKLNAKAQT